MEIVGQTVRWPYIGSAYLSSPIVWLEVMARDGGKYDVRGYRAIQKDGSMGDELLSKEDAERVGCENARAYLISLRPN